MTALLPSAAFPAPLHHQRRAPGAWKPQRDFTANDSLLDTIHGQGDKANHEGDQELAPTEHSLDAFLASWTVRGERKGYYGDNLEGTLWDSTERY